MLIEIIRGDDKTRNITVTTPDGTPVDLSEAQQITFTAKRRMTDSDDDAVIRKSLGDGIEVDDETSNVAHIAFVPDDTNDLTVPRLLVFDLEVIDAEGKVATILIGYLRITPDVTREATIES